MENSIPGDAPAEKQVHVFDFDDTLGVTKNPNGVMIFINGKPAHKDVASAQEWVNKAGLNQYLTNKGKAEIIMSPLEGAAFYVDSAGLAKVYDYIKKNGGQVITYDPIGSRGSPGDWKKIYKTTGVAALADYSPSNDIDINTTEPIPSTIDKLKKLNASGAQTAVMTARQGGGKTKGLDDEEKEVTNVKDIEKFLSKHGAKPNAGIMGVQGADKGQKIKQQFISNNEDGDNPEEIHFYDDAKRNTDDVASIGGKMPAELHVYGPGHFVNNEADPNKPNQSFEPEEEKRKKVAEMIKKIIREELRNYKKKNKQ